MSKETMFYMKGLASEKCHCGAYKAKGRSFCFKCYHLLPESLKGRIWLRIGNGYEEAYDAAAKFLDTVKDNES